MEVLLIDDDADLLETMKLILSNEYHVRTAPDGLEALNELKRKLPDIIIIDLAMPNVDGVEILRAVRKNWDSTPVIVYTAYSNEKIMKRAMEYSPFTLLSKPAEMDALLRTVRFISLGIKNESDTSTRIASRPHALSLEAGEGDGWMNDRAPEVQELEVSQA
jgi:DNA-binding response OmpR family regulator